jgi:myo-inositol-1(or 4)-monophosphatase
MDTLAAVVPEVAGIRRFGAAALDLAWVAAGRFDGYWENGLLPWDIAAGILLIREAGGAVTDMDGGDAMLARGDILAANGLLHRPLSRLISAAAKS